MPNLKSTWTMLFGALCGSDPPYLGEMKIGKVMEGID